MPESLRDQPLRKTVIADENIDRTVVELLEASGRKTISIRDTTPGISDQAVAALAIRHHAFLLTEDKDFGELVYRQTLSKIGIILLRLHGMSAFSKGTLLCKILDKQEYEMIDSFTVISPGAVRIRKSPSGG